MQPIFLRSTLDSSSMFGTGIRYGLEILHNCGKRIETKSQKIFGKWNFCPRSPILNRDKVYPSLFLIEIDFYRISMKFLTIGGWKSRHELTIFYYGR